MSAALGRMKRLFAKGARDALWLRLPRVELGLLAEQEAIGAAPEPG